MAKQFILIGGAPTTGKSVMAKRLAKHFDLPWISTDQLRAIIKPYGDVDRFPTLYDSHDMSAEEFLTRYNPQEISDMEFSQGKDVWPAVKGLVSGDSDWHNGGVIEGVNILPHLIADTDFENNSFVKPVFLVDLDEERMREVVYKRGLYAPADQYSDDVKEKEVEWALIFAKRLKKEAMKYGFPCVSVTKRDGDFLEVLKKIEN